MDNKEEARLTYFMAACEMRNSDGEQIWSSFNVMVVANSIGIGITGAALTQAGVSGSVGAVLIAANTYGRYFPLLTTAAGTAKPANVLILGIGVAGLQAIGTAKRLGAVVKAYDVRAETKEQAQSLGAHPVRAFFEVTLGVIKPGVVAGAIFAFAISFDNFTLSLFLTSAKLTPLPIELFAYLKYSFDPTAAAVSAFAIGVALVLVVGIARFMGLEEFTGF